MTDIATVGRFDDPDRHAHGRFTRLPSPAPQHPVPRKAQRVAGDGPRRQGGEVDRMANGGRNWCAVTQKR